jgi:ADP-ribosylglycohydrolase
MNEKQLIDILYTGKKNDRISAAVSLLEHPSINTLDALIDATTADSLHIRRAAAIVIGESRYEEGIPTLINLLKRDPVERVRWNAALALSNYPTSTITNYVEKASATTDQEKWTLSFLATNKDNFPEYKQHLERGLHNVNDSIRSLAVTNIARLDWNEYKNKIIELTDDPSAAVREASYVAILENAKETFQELIPKLEADEDEHIRALSQYTKGPRNKQEKNYPEMQDKFIACILGGAIGDALGGPIEGHRYSKIKEKFGTVTDFMDYQYTFTEPRELGEWTDDTEMALGISDALIALSFIHPNDLAQRFGEDMKQMDINKKKQRGYATFSASRQRKNYAGVNWRFTSDDSSGCGSAMRAHPIGLFYNNSDEDLIQAARDSSIVSHSGDDAIASTILIAYAVSRALHLEKGFDKNKFAEDCIALVQPYSQDLAERITNIRKDRELEVHELVEKYGGNGHTRTVSIALECFLRHSDSYQESVTQAINHSGDSDSIGSMAGAMVAAHLGTNAIPTKHKELVYQRQLLESTAKKLYDTYLTQ